MGVGIYDRFMKVSVVIPVLNAERHLPALLPALLGQQPRPPDEVLLLDSMSTDRTRAIAAGFTGVRVLPVEKFCHSGTRNLGAREAHGDVVVLMTQDALPRDTHWLAALLAPLADPTVAASYSRQVPYPDANPMEQFFLRTHFPPESVVRRATGGGAAALGLRDVFFSNVSGAVRRDLLLRHPFDERLIMSEDQQLSRDLMAAGHAVAYAADSVVTHSHNYTLSVCFRRYFDSVYSLTQVFPSHGMGTSAGMGAAYVRREFAWMVRHHPHWLPYYVLYNGAKVAGTLAAHYAERMPRSWARRCSLHRYYWD